MSEPAPARSGSAGILVVDDEPQVREGVARLLALEGHTVFRAATAEEALACVASESIDLVITDMLMPGMGGAELALRVHAINRGIRVVLMSGYAPDSDIHEAAAPRLIKPFSGNDLLKTVNQVLGRAG